MQFLKTVGNALKRLGEHPAVLLAIRVFVGGIFFLFGVVKAIEPKEEFYASVAEYQMIPSALIPTFGTIVIYAEIVFGLLLILGLFRKWSAIAVTGMLVMFIIAIAQTGVRGIELVNCGCSGSAFHIGETANEVISRDAFFLLLMVWYLAVEAKTRTTAWTADRFFSKKAEFEESVEESE